MIVVGCKADLRVQEKEDKRRRNKEGYEDLAAGAAFMVSIAEVRRSLCHFLPYLTSSRP